MSKVLTRSPSFGVIVSKSGAVRASGGSKSSQSKVTKKELSLVDSKKSQQRIVNNLFLTRKKTSELYDLLEG